MKQTTFLSLAGRSSFVLGAALFAGGAHASPTVAGTTISWPDDGWYQVQTADGAATLCSGGSSCDVSPGTYLVINHSTGERFTDVTVSGTSTPAPTGISVVGGTISWPDDGWYQVQTADGSATLCNGGSSCEVDPGQYLLINHTTGQRFPGVVVSEGAGPPRPPAIDAVTVTGNVITMPEDGWYQVQTADGSESVCNGETSCEVPAGRYLVINHTTGERFEDIVVGGSTPVTPPSGVDSVTVDGTSVSWPDDGWYQVQNADTFESVCEGGVSCDVAPGTYFVINLSTGERQTVSVEDGTSPPAGSEMVDVTFDITVPFLVSNALQVSVTAGDTLLTAAWLIDESWSVTGELAANTDTPLSVVFFDDNGAITLASVDTRFTTGADEVQEYQVTADQFDSDRWDTDGDGTSNLDELRVGRDPLVVDTTDPTGPTPVPALNISVYSGFDLELFWSAASDDVVVVGYDIYRNGELQVAMLDALSYYDSSVEPESEYVYTLYAVDNDGFRSTPMSVTVDTPPDVPVTGVPVQFESISGGASASGEAVWIISDGLTTTTGSPTSGSCTTRGGAGSGVGVRDATLTSESGTRQGDAFDNASLLWINGEQVGGFLRAATESTSNYAPVPLSGLDVSVQYHAVSNSSTLRHYTTLRNETDSDILAVVNIASNFGSDSGTTVYTTSSGDLFVGTDDRWIITDDFSTTSGDPANTTVFYGPGSPRSRVVSVQRNVFNCATSDGLNARLDVVVPAGSQRALLFFHQLSASSVNADVEALQFETTPAVGSALVEGLSAEQLSEIVNWDF
jgi:hypothetical protein